MRKTIIHWIFLGVLGLAPAAVLAQQAAQPKTKAARGQAAKSQAKTPEPKKEDAKKEEAKIQTEEAQPKTEDDAKLTSVPGGKRSVLANAQLLRNSVGNSAAQRCDDGWECGSARQCGAKEKTMNFTELIGHVGIFGGAVIVSLALLSVFSVAMIIDKHRRFSSTTRESEKFKPEFKKFLHGGDVQNLLEAARQHQNSHVAQVVSAGIIEYDGVAQSGGDASASFDLVTSAIRDSISETLINLKKGLGFLATIGSTVPFVGLFGTVVGIINAFRSIAATGSGGMSVVSGGIAEALVSTALGIFVAIPAVVAFNHFTGKLETFHVEMNRASSQLINRLFKIPELKGLDAEMDEVKAAKAKKEGPAYATR